MQQAVAITLIVLGIVAVVVALAADSLGISSFPNAIGWKQITLAIAGAGAAVVGILWLIRLRSRSR